MDLVAQASWIDTDDSFNLVEMSVGAEDSFESPIQHRRRVNRVTNGDLRSTFENSERQV